MHHLRLSRRGQFTIIAAMLVAVVLIAAVMTTYSAIRYTELEEQPRILSAVDEINLALKHILGFTVGYYGSVLQVTGNTSYARALAANYLQSGLNNIGDTRPELGVSFDIKTLELRAHWFSNVSYSAGTLEVTYDLMGIGIYGVTYSASCRLDVQVLGSSSSQAFLNITRDEAEPIVNLAKENIKFYRYLDSASTWELVSPSVEPIVYANGTYVVDFPAAVDSDAYMIKVEDTRGIIVVASSFSRYTGILTVNSTYNTTPDYVDLNDSDIDLSPDKGTQSNFAAQQSAPDSIYDRLTEVNIGGGIANVTLINGESFEGTWLPSGWSESPSDSKWNKESDRRFNGTYSADFDGSGYGNLYTPSLNCSDATAIYVDFWYYHENCDNNEFRLYYYDGSNWDFIYQLGNDPEGQWIHYQHKITDNQYFKSDFKIRFSASPNQNGENAYIDLVTVIKEINNASYQLDLEEQWINANYTDPTLTLCIKAGSLGSEPLLVDVWNTATSSWVNVAALTSLVNGWKNVSVASYVTSPIFTIRFRGSSEDLDTIQDTWEIDSILLSSRPPLSFFSLQEDSTIVVEWLQNGTMRWLGQNLNLITEAKPIPPVPIKCIHLNQTINGVEMEAPFQIEDWASNYRIPLGLTNNATVFSNKQMIVFLLNSSVSKFTLWWNGSDEAIQTPLAHTNFYFSDNPDNRILNNGRVRLQVTSTGFNINSTVGSVNSTANLMRINNRYDTTEPEWAWVIVNGVVRSIIQGEAEWSGGISDCPNVYSNIVITLPANVTYYTYQLRLMFINSTRPRTIWDLCPIQLSTSLSSIQMMTENGTANGFPIVNSTGAFYNYNYTSGGWTAHHWSQIITDTKGAGIMFTDSANQQLYAFDAIGPSAGTPTGALNVTATTNGLIQLQPVTIRQVQFQDARDFTWHGAVVTFDDTTPIYRSSDESGLWLLVEYPPAITVTTTG